MTTKIDIQAAQKEVISENEKLLAAGYVLPVLEEGAVVFVSTLKGTPKVHAGKAA